MNDPLTPCVSKPMVTPIINAVNYEFCSFEVLKQITEDGRDGNPTVRAVEKKIADLEQTDNCILCTSGMTACSLVYLTYLSAGDHLILFHDIYSAHYSVSLILERMGIEVTWLGAEKSNDISPYVKPKTKMIFYETPTNTLCKVINIAETAKVARKNHILLVVDNTYATPYHQNPLNFGADLVVHSATKALGGHNDLIAGAIVGKKKYFEKLWLTRQTIGTTLDAYSASLLERGLKTFQLRIVKMSANALVMASYLKKHPKVSRVFYPGLHDDPQHEIACKQMAGGFGSVFSFDVDKPQEDAKKFISNLKTIYHAVSIGSTESLVCVPYLTTMLFMPPERRTSFGVNRNTVRISAGIERVDLLLDDLEQALSKI